LYSALQPWQYPVIELNLRHHHVYVGSKCLLAKLIAARPDQIRAVSYGSIQGSLTWRVGLFGKKG
jgi:hypothetical protein